MNLTFFILIQCVCHPIFIIQILKYNIRVIADDRPVLAVYRINAALLQIIQRVRVEFTASGALGNATVNGIPPVREIWFKYILIAVFSIRKAPPFFNSNANVFTCLHFLNRNKTAGNSPPLKIPPMPDTIFRSPHCIQRYRPIQ